MRKPSIKQVMVLTAALLAAAAGLATVSIYRSVLSTLATERSRVGRREVIPFEKEALFPFSGRGASILQNTREIRDIARFRDSYFAATSGGLVQFSAEGEVGRHFTVLDGLPESDLTCLAVFEGKLFIGTRTSGLLAFDGGKFEGYDLNDRKTDAITSLFADDSELLIGTFSGGLLRFDGEDFTEIKTDNKGIAAVNRIAKNGTTLFVGTFNDGLWIREGGTWSHFTTAEGLPSSRVVAIQTRDHDLYIATDFGLAVRENDSFRTVATVPSLSDMILDDKRLLLIKDNGEIYAFDVSIRKISDKAGMRNSHFAFAGGNLWLLTGQGILLMDGTRAVPFAQVPNEPLIDNFVSALAIDDDSNLWAGTFRGGIDVISPDGGPIRHIETDAIREINFLQQSGDGVRAATSAGVYQFGRNFAIVKSLTRKDGLPSGSVAHFSDDAFATAKGLAFKENGRLRIISAVQGLPSNSTYATLKAVGKLYVGTLNGLAEVENNRVVRTFRDSNSGLRTNWVTALCIAGERLFIGTYGGGVFELLPSGDIRSFEPEIGKFTVNFNSMFSDGERLYIGTLEGVHILDLKIQSWTNVQRVLPSQNVMSIAGDVEAVYFGTSSGVARVDKHLFANGEAK